MTHILENVDRKNEYLNSPKTHNTNSILIQNCSDDQQFLQTAHVEPNYYFQEKTTNHLEQRQQLCLI